MAFGKTGGASGGGTNPTITTLTEGQVPKANASQKLVYGNATVDPTTLEWTFDESINVPSGSIKVGEVLQLTEGTADLITVDLLDNQMAFVVRSNFDDSVGAAPPFYVDYGGAQTIVIQATDTTVITANPLDFQVIGTVVAPDIRLVDQLVLRANGAMTNARLRVTDNATGLVVRYFPSKTDFLNGVGFSLIAGDNTFFLASDAADTPGNFHLGFQPFVIEDSQLLDLRIEADAVDLLGNASNIPFIEIEAHDGPPRSVGGNVTAAASLTNNAVVIGQGGINVATSTRVSIDTNQLILQESVVNEDLFIQFKDDVAANHFQIQYDGTNNDVEIESFLSNSISVISDNTLTLEADTLLQFRSITNGIVYDGVVGPVFTQSTNDLTTVATFNNSGTNPGQLRLFAGNRTPEGNVTTTEAAYWREDGVNTDLFIRPVGTSGNTGWRGILGTIDTLTWANVLSAGSTSSNTNPTINFNSANPNGPNLVFQKSRGTEATPTAVLSGDFIANLNIEGHDGTAFPEVASIDVIANENFSGAARGARMEFNTTPNGTTSQETNIVISNNLITLSAPTGLTVSSNRTTTDVINVQADSLTTGSIASFISNSANTGTRNVAEFINNNVLATGATVLRLQQDSTGFALDSQGDVNIAGKLTVSGLIDPTGLVLDEQATVPGGAPGAARGTVWVRNDAPNELIFTDDAGTDHTIVGTGATDTLAEVLANGNTTGGTNIAITSGDAITSTTTDQWLNVAANLGASEIGFFYDASTLGNSARMMDIFSGINVGSDVELVRILQGDAIPGGTTTCLSMENFDVNAGIVISATGRNVFSGGFATTATIMQVTGDQLTTGSVASFTSNSSNASTRNLANFINDNVLATGTTCVSIRQDSINQALELDAATTTVPVFTILANSLTTGNMALFASDSASISTRDLVNIVNDNPLATGTTCLNLQQDSTGGAFDIVALTTTGNVVNVTGNSLTTGSLATYTSSSADIGTRQLFNITNSNAASTGTIPLFITQNADHFAQNVQATGVTTEIAFFIQADALTTGCAFQVSSNSVDTSARFIADVINDNVLATAAVCLRLQQDSTGSALTIPAATTTSNVIDVTGNSLTTGTLASFISNSASTGIRNVVNVVNDNPLATGATCINIQQDAATTALNIAQNANGKAIQIETSAVTGNFILDIESDGLTTGSIARFFDGSVDTSIRELVQITNSSSAATGAICLDLDQNSTGPLILLDRSGATVEVFADNATAVGNITGDPGDVNFLESGVNSNIQVHIGASANNTDWAGCVGGPAVVMFGANGVASTTTTRYLFPGYSENTGQTTAIAMRMPRTGFIRNMHIQHNIPAGNGGAIVYTVRVNAVASALTVSIPSTTTTASDTTNVVSVTAGDTIDIEVTKVAGIGSTPNDVVATLEYV